MITKILSLFSSRYGRDYYINQSGVSKTMQNQVSGRDVATLEKSIVQRNLPRIVYRNSEGTDQFVKNPIYREGV